MTAVRELAVLLPPRELVDGVMADIRASNLLGSEALDLGKRGNGSVHTRLAARSVAVDTGQPEFDRQAIAAPFDAISFHQPPAARSPT
jgi:hypothetical protein